MDNKCFECNENLSNIARFGFSECFHVHIYCYPCIEKLSVNDLRCPRDKIHSRCIQKKINNKIVDVDKYFLDLIRSLKYKRIRESYRLIEELSTESETIFSLSRCIGCFNDQAIELTFGLNCCFPAHRFCFNCMAEIARKDLRCPIDNKVSQVIKIKTNEVVICTDKLYFQAIKFLETQCCERSNELIREIQINGQIGLSICCKCFREFENETIFGFAQCFFKHALCLNCMLHLKGCTSNCPIDGNLCKVLQMSLNNVITEVDRFYFDVLINLPGKKRPYIQIEEQPRKSLMYLSKICSNCKKDISSELLLGLNECLAEHIFCYKCAEKIVDREYLCPIDKRQGSGIKIVTDNSLLEVDEYHFQMLKYLKGKKSYNGKLCIQNLKICSQMSLKLIRCAKCFCDLRSEALLGFSECFYRHGFCFPCISKISKRDLRCPIDHQVSSCFKVRSNNVAIDLDKYHIYTVNYLQSKPYEISDKLLQTVMFIKAFPVNVCISCLKDKSGDKFMIGFKECVKYHRMCVECAVEVHCSGRENCVMEHGHDSISIMVAVSDKMVSGSDEKDPVNVDVMFMRTYNYLVHIFTSRNMDSSCGILKHMRDNLRYPNDVCVRCLQSIFNVCYGFSSCNSSHVFCENCATYITVRDNKCPVDDTSIDAIYKLLRKTDTKLLLDVNYFKIMQYLQKPSFDKVRAKILRNSLHEQGFFSNTVCIFCLVDEGLHTAVVHQCNYKHRLCSKCLSKGDALSLRCPIDMEAFRRI